MSVDGSSSTAVNIEANDETERPRWTKEERHLRLKERRKNRKIKRKERKMWRRAFRDAVQKDPNATTVKASGLPRRKLMAGSECAQRIAIDCSFEHMMTFKRVCELHHQLSQCYGSNRRAENPCQFYICSVGDVMEARFAEMGNIMGASWDVVMTKANLTETFDVSSIIYLSKESETELETLDPQKVYVIGGFGKDSDIEGHSYRIATEAGMATARLPIDRYIRLTSSLSMGVNQVFQLLLMRTQGHGWSSCLQMCIPRRKWVNIVDSNTVDSKPGSLDHDSPDGVGV